MLTLPDSVFFELMRNYLGDLKTPFNKHDLLRSLENMLNRPLVRENLFKLIDDEDRKILTAIELLSPVSIDELSSFFGKNYSFIELHNRVVNLQERLLTEVDYRDHKQHSSLKLSLNTLFRDELKERVLDTSLLFPNSPGTDIKTEHRWFNTGLITAFLSFVSDNPLISRLDGNARKKIVEKFEESFDAAIKQSRLSAEDLIISLYRSIKTLGFLREDSGYLRLNITAVREFAQMQSEKQSLLLSAAAVFHAPGSGALKDTEALQGELAAAAELNSSFFSMLESGHEYKKNVLEGIMFSCRKIYGRTNQLPSMKASSAVKSLTAFGFISHCGSRYCMSAPDSIQKDAVIRVEPNFEISAPPGITMEAELTAALCSKLLRYDLVSTYILEKTSFSIFRNSELTSEELIADLEKYSGRPLPQNLSFTISTWEKEYRSMDLNYGIVLTVSKERLPLIEHSPNLKEFFLSVPAPGVFILDPDRENEWRRAFINAGFEMLPEVRRHRQTQTVELLPASSISRFKQSTGFKAYKTAHENNAQSIIEEQLKNLVNRKMAPAQKQNLEARIQKKLILDKSQLTVSSRPEEKGEAGALDHRGKLRLVERALELENLLEVSTPKDLEIEKKLIKPLRLAKLQQTAPDKPAVNILIGLELPSEKETEIPVNRISFLKMLKSSLFTP